MFDPHFIVISNSAKRRVRHRAFGYRLAGLPFEKTGTFDDTKWCFLVAATMGNVSNGYTSYLLVERYRCMSWLFGPPKSLAL